MNNALRFHLKISLKNMIKRTFKRPLKTIGILFLTIYFVSIPFTMKNLMTTLGLANAKGFVLVNTGMTIYIVMPATLTYFKRNGVLFRKQDVNFMFASPISPKQVLLYALFKQAYMTILMQIVGFIAAIYLFLIPLHLAVFYSLSNFIFSNLMSYSLAIIMYASERLSEKTKRGLKWAVYLGMVAVTILLILYFIQNGVSAESAMALISHPLILGIPIFGWELGWMNLILLGATPLTIITGSLFLITSVILGLIAYRMKSTGDYYEDALQFSERQEKIIAKQGDVSLNDVFNRKRKVYNHDSKINAKYSRAIFSRQIIERRRTRRFFISFGDLLSLLFGITAGVLSLYGELESSLYFPIACGISLYLTIFFTPSSIWKEEFSKYFLYVIPDTMWNKLLGATLMEHLVSLLRAIFLALPFGLIIGAPFLDIIFVIIAQVLLKAMIIYKSIFIDGYIGAKIGAVPAQFVSIFVSVIVVIIPVIAVIASIAMPTYFSFAIVAVYSIAMMFLFMYLCVRTLTNIESLSD